MVGRLIVSWQRSWPPAINFKNHSNSAGRSSAQSHNECQWMAYHHWDFVIILTNCHVYFRWSLPIVVYINVINTYVLSTPSSAESEDLAANSKEPWWSATYYSSQLGSRTLPNPIRNWNPLAVKILRCQSVWSNRLTDVLLLYKSCDKEIVDVVVLAGKYFLFVKTNILRCFIYGNRHATKLSALPPMLQMIIRLITCISYILMQCTNR